MSASHHDVTVALTFDFDAMSSWIGTLGATSPSMISRGEFSPIGVRRLLKLLDEYDITATFFTPGHTAVAFPRIVAEIRDAGHEIGHHGWVHENPVSLTLEQERVALERGLDALAQTAEVRPIGYRSPAWDNSPHTVELLLEYGFEYESSLMGNDYEPYWCRVGDRWSPTDPYVFGTPVPLVELPVAWYLDDVPHFEFIFTSQLFSQGLSPPSSVLEIWREEFDYLYHERHTGVLIITMHPEVTGRGHRLRMLRDLLSHIADHSGVSFSSCDDYARKWREGRTPGLPDYVADQRQGSSPN